MDEVRLSRMSISDPKFLLPASLSLRRSRLEPEKFQEIKLDSFKVIGFLGSGSFAQVLHVRKKGTREEYALKQINKKFIIEAGMSDQIKKEVVYMHNLTKKGCPYIVKLIDHFEDDENVYLIMEYLKGGQLMDLIKDNGFLKENVACHIIRDVLLAIAAMHENKLIHRDIKPENVLLTEIGRAKLADFGWSNSIETDSMTRKTYCGTADYLAPEIIQGHDHDDSVDLWCLGVLIFELLYGFAPFSPRSLTPGSYDYQPNLERKILKIDYTLPKTRPVTKYATDLIAKLLKKKPKERIRIPEIMKSKWFKHFGLSFIAQEIEVEQPMEDLLAGMQKNTFGDPFSRQSVAEEEVIEEEIQQEMIDINRERRHRLKLLKIKPKDGECSDDDLNAAEQRLHQTKSADKLRKVNKGDDGGLSARSIGNQAFDINANKKHSNFKPIEQMRIYYKQNMEVIQKDREDMEEVLMTKISKLTNNSATDVDAGYATETAGTPKSMVMIEEIDRGYDKFERVPMDSSTQTTEQIIINLPDDPRTRQIQTYQKQIEDYPIVCQMLEEQQLEFQYNSDRLKDLKDRIEDLNTETIEINKKAKFELEKKKVLEKQLCNEAQNFGMKIEEKQKKISDLRFRLENLVARAKRNPS